MPVNLLLRCQCGHVRGVARDVAPSTGFRFVCYCADCQAFARSLQRPDVLDAAGGTDIFHIAAGRVTLTAGTDALRCVRFSDKVLRWYAQCCRTPIANTAASPRFPVVALIHCFMDHDASGPSRDAALGPPLCRIYERSATGPLPADAPPPPSLSLFARRGAKLLGWWWRGLGRPHPFFDAATGAPVAAPRAVTPQERGALATEPSDPRQYRPHVARNRDPIFVVLRRVLPPRGLVLEVASGSGEHAAYLAARLPALTWQPSDPDPRALASIASHRTETGALNLLPPLHLDVTAGAWPVERADVVMCCNMIHIAPWAACEGLIAGAARVLPVGGLLYLYGPYKIDGRHTAPSNEAFDRDLRSRDPAWGIRDLAEVTALAMRHGLVLAETVAMPANNLSVIFRRR
jgi:hypothetical protein